MTQLAHGDGGSQDTGRPTLGDLQREFPRFAIWREVTGDRTRYIARRAHDWLHPHTVVTADMDEMRTILAQDAGSEPGGLTGPPPNIARMYSYWMGGKDHLAADRAAAQQVLAGFPEVAEIATANRAFVTRAVGHVAAHGITQFLDIGAGLPTWPAVHEIAWQYHTTARVCYVDNDDVVLAHARALLAAGPNVTVAHGDLRQGAALLKGPQVGLVIDFSRPVCVILAAVLHFLEPAEADRAVAGITAAMVPGSFLVVSAGTSTGTDPALVEQLGATYAGTATIAARTEAEIAAWLAGMEPLPPGLTDVRDWRPGRPAHSQRSRPAAARFLAAVARKSPPAR